MLANHRRQLETVEVGHADVDQDHGHVVAQKRLQRLVGRRGLEQNLAELLSITS